MPCIASRSATPYAFARSCSPSSGSGWSMEKPCDESFIRGVAAALVVSVAAVAVGRLRSGAVFMSISLGTRRKRARLGNAQAMARCSDFQLSKGFVCNRDEGRRYSRPIGSLRDDEIVPLICPTCQVFAESLKVSCQRLLLLCMGLFSIFRAPSRCGRACRFLPFVPDPPGAFP